MWAVVRVQGESWRDSGTDDLGICIYDGIIVDKDDKETSKKRTK